MTVTMQTRNRIFDKINKEVESNVMKMLKIMYPKYISKHEDDVKQEISLSLLQNISPILKKTMEKNSVKSFIPSVTLTTFRCVESTIFDECYNNQYCKESLDLINDILSEDKEDSIDESGIKKYSFSRTYNDYDDLESVIDFLETFSNIHNCSEFDKFIKNIHAINIDLI